MDEPTGALIEQDPMTLVELVNRVVDRGVVLRGGVTISVADIDLIYLGIDLLLCAVDRMEEGETGQRSDRDGGEGS